MWIYREKGREFQVGYYQPSGYFYEDATFTTRKQCRDRISHLNGNSINRMTFFFGAVVMFATWSMAVLAVVAFFALDHYVAF